MRIYHYSKKDSIDSIFNSKTIWMSKLVDLGQGDICLTIDEYRSALSNCDPSKVKYNGELDKDEFVKLLKSDFDVNECASYDVDMYGACFTKHIHLNDKLTSERGDDYISVDDYGFKFATWDLNIIFSGSVIYSLTGIDQDLYRIFNFIYVVYVLQNKKDYHTDDVPVDYGEMLAIGYYYLRSLYKSGHKYEDEYRIVLDAKRKERNELTRYKTKQCDFGSHVCKLTLNTFIGDAIERCGKIYYVYKLGSDDRLKLERKR